MTATTPSRSRATWVKGLVVMAILSGLLGGCTSGTSEARQADEAFVTLEHVAEVETAVDRPGRPTNRQFRTYVTFVEGVTQEEQAQTLDEMLVIARDVLGPAANTKYILYVAGGKRAIDMEAVVESLGDVGDQSPNDVSVGSLILRQDVLRAYESPRGDT